MSAAAKQLRDAAQKIGNAGVMGNLRHQMVTITPDAAIRLAEWLRYSADSNAYSNKRALVIAESILAREAP